MMFSSPLSIDVGVITTFAGGIGNIPPGWFLCDGTHGTPDLRDKFIPATGPLFSVGDEGGFTTHDHGFTGDGHDHTFGVGPGIQGGFNLDRTGSIDPITGTTNAGSSLPTYYALAYIQCQGV